MSPNTSKVTRIAILASGRGSNMVSLAENLNKMETPAEICTVISNRHDAQVLNKAQALNISTILIDQQTHPNRESFDTHLQKEIENHQIDLIVLAGFMRILTPRFVHQYEGRLLNIHPSLLPAYPGLNTHQRALDDHVLRHGASVHFVTPELDAGPVILQGSVPVFHEDSTETLAARVLRIEHLIYPKVVDWFARDRLHYHNDQIWLDNTVLTHPPIIRLEDLS